MTCIALSILVVVAGVFLLAKTKTDDLGAGFKFASYATILSGLLMTGATLTMCLDDCCSKKGGHHGHEYHQSCKGQDGCSGATSCSKSDKCSKGDKCCKGGAKSCSKGDKCCKGEAKSCSKSEKSCSKEAKSCKKEASSCTKSKKTCTKESEAVAEAIN